MREISKIKEKIRELQNLVLTVCIVRKSSITCINWLIFFHFGFITTVIFLIPIPRLRDYIDLLFNKKMRFLIFPSEVIKYSVSEMLNTRVNISILNKQLR